MPAYSPTEGPAIRPAHDPERHIAAVVTTFEFGRRTTESHVTLACHAHDLDPEWRAPIFWFEHMLDTDEGAAVRADWARMADDHADGDVSRDLFAVTVAVDGVCILDAPGCEAAADFEYAVTKAEKAVLNP